VPVRPVGRLVLDRVVDNFFAETEQAAFCTQNVVPGIDFTNDPLLQGRNFSYLDTQLKRLGSPNFTRLPVNAPKCPVAHFQQDGHMATSNPVNRVNYEPNSWPTAEGGPREDPAGGYRTFQEEVTGAKRRLRPESFADHYSQARQFYISQNDVERKHIAEAFTFELSKCDREEIRTRMVAGLRNVDDELAANVAEGLGLRELPAPAEPARQPRQDLPPSPALSILASQDGPRGPRSFAGRKLGVLVTNGADAETLAALRGAAEAEGVTVEIIAPAVGGVDISDGTRVRADQQLDGAPSVLYDAVAILAEPGGARALAARPPARDFVTDAVAHCKFIGYTSGAAVLFEAAGLPLNPADEDDGFISLGEHPAAEFIARCRQLRFWQREFATAG
jgi:catalase